MAYTRVIPRDLFNESKLLKCLGQLSLIIHDGTGVQWPMTIDHCDFQSPGFDIYQRESDGGLACDNVTFRVHGRIVDLYTSYNSKSPYPLLFEQGDDFGPVFDDNGQLSKEFITFCIT